MATKEITDFTAVTTAAVGDLLLTQQAADAVTRKLTLTQLDTLLAATTKTLTNKTIDLASNTLTGTTAQFNTALSDGDFATLAGTETLTNKTLTTPTLTTPTIASLVNATHSHQNAAGGGTLDASAIAAGTLALARGGLAVSLSDPNADRLLFWDDSAGAMAFLTLGSGLSITGTTMTSSAGGLNSVQIFTADGTWTRPSGVTKVIVEVQGGGGGGGGVDGVVGQASAAGGGGAGGYARKFIDVSAIATSTITVGSGGAGGAAGINNGAAGTASSWVDGTNTVSGNGGNGGTGSGGTASDQPGAGAGTGGSASGGDLNSPGGGGFIGARFGVGQGAFSGAGGSSRLGGGGRAVTDNSAGADGTAYGGGGSGASANGGTDSAGGNGASGVIYVWEFQ